MTVREIVNSEQAAAWDGDEGDYWTEHESRFDDAVRAYNGRFFAAAAIAPRDRVLDIGCGCGETTRETARLAYEGHALGVDLSRRMLDRARARSAAEGLDNVAFEQADAQIYPFPERGFDIAISRTGAMFFGDPVAAFANIGRALTPDRRVVLLVWQGFADNEWIVSINGALAAGREFPPPAPEAPSPFSLADPERVRGILTAAGFARIEFGDVRAPMYFGRDADDACTFVAQFMHWMLAELDEARRADALSQLHATMAAHDSGLGVIFRSRMWLVTARRA